LILPTALLQSLQSVQGFNQPAFEKVHASGEQSVSIRINPGKITNPTILFSSDTNRGAVLTPVPWCDNGYYLSARPSFTADPLFHAGAYYVQEASSMFLEVVMQQHTAVNSPLKVLDLCAAPGGKSTLLQSILHPDSLLVSNEVIKSRVTILAENITKWGAPNVVVTNNDPQDFQRLPGFFDVIVVDAPCSGSGLFRKDFNAINEWSEQNVVMCSQRQQRILEAVLPALKHGGLLVYATCSYSPAEDEDRCDWLAGRGQLTSVACQVPPSWNIVETTAPVSKAAGYRFFPDQLQGEGFFIAAFIKEGTANETPNTGSKTKSGSVRLPAREIEVVSQWLNNPDQFNFIYQQSAVLAVPVYLAQHLAQLQSTLYIKQAGITLGNIIRNELIPAHDLAMSTLLVSGLPTIEVDRSTALQYLRRQEIGLNSQVRGWALLTFEGLPLGWVKALGNRVNNYYPKEWRILHK